MPIHHLPNRFVVGVELGGTKMLAGIFNAEVLCLKTAKRSTKPERGPEAVVERIARCVQDVVDEADTSLDVVGAIAIGVPGAVDRVRGRVLHAPLLDWSDFDLADRLQQTLGLPVLVENDHDLATLGIYALELRVKPRRLLALFIGSRIGGGWMVDGQLCVGFADAAGGVGHMVLDPLGPKCRCGGRGCFESLASRQAVLERIHEAIRAGRRSVLTDALDRLGSLRARDLHWAFRSGDPLTREVMESTAHWIGIALKDLVKTLQPDVVVLGGRVVGTLRECLPEFIFGRTVDGSGRTMDGVPILVSSLEAEACISGAAWMAWRRTD